MILGWRICRHFTSVRIVMDAADPLAGPGNRASADEGQRNAAVLRLS